MIKPIKLKPFPKFCINEGIDPSVFDNNLGYDECLSYFEMLQWLCDYLSKTVIPSVNTTADGLEELQNLYITLKNYVDNYFDNLDVQQEINNKLDEMVTDGTLENILSHYIDNHVERTYTTLTALKQADLHNSSRAKTLGYYTLNDGGCATYIIKSSQPSGYYETLNNGMYAELIHNNYNVNPKQFGCYGDGITDDTVNFQKCLDYAGSKNFKIILNGLFLVNNLKLKSNNDNYIYNIIGNVNKQKGSNESPLKNGFITNTNVFNTDLASNIPIQLHLDSINANVKDSSIEKNSFILKCHLEKSSIINSNINGFSYVIYGSTNVNTVISNNNFKNITKAFLRVYEGSGYGFYDSTIQNNYINAYHEGDSFHGIPSKRTSILIDTERTGFGNDGRFINNFVDYFTYFIDKDMSWELTNDTVPSYSSKFAGLVTNNVFQNMLNMLGLGINLRGTFTNNLFDNFARDTIYNYLNNTNCGAFSIATYECEINDEGTNIETPFPYRKFDGITISNNEFQNTSRPVYFDFNYDTYPGVTASSLLSNIVVIMNNRTSSGTSFDKLSVFTPQYNDDIFLYNKIQMWNNINMSTVAMDDYRVLHNHKIYAGNGSIARFSDGIYVAYYVSSRNYSWKKIADI